MDTTNIPRIAHSQAIETLSHHDIIEAVAVEYGWDASSSSIRAFRSYLKSWCEFCGSSLAEPAIGTLNDSTAQELTLLTEERELAKQGLRRGAKNVRWAVTEALRVLTRLRLSADLPGSFTKALNALLTAKGWSSRELAKALRTQYPEDAGSRQVTAVHDYVAGRSSPFPYGARAALTRVLVERMEVVLGAPAGALTSRAYRDPGLLIKMGNPAPIRYRTHLGKVNKSAYKLNAMPAHLDRLWRDIKHHRSQPVIRFNGEHYAAKGVWGREASADLFLQCMLRYLGWLTLPAPTRPLYELEEAERWQTGKGIPELDLSVTHWLDVELLWEHLEFLRDRQCNKEFSRFNMRFIAFIKMLVSEPYSYLRMHPELAPAFGQNLKGAAWAKYVESELLPPVQTLSKNIIKVCPKERQRHPDEPLKAVFHDQSPALLALEMISRMENHLPPATQCQRLASHLRDIALCRMGLEIPLRARNLSELCLESHLTKDATTGLWTVSVAKNELKNHHSPHANNIFRSYSEETSKAIDDYLERGRPSLVMPDASKHFFLLRRVGDQAKHRSAGCDGRVNPRGISGIVRAVLKRYFGVGVGANIFRHLIATSILKDDSGQVETAAAVLNNSPDTVRANYKHLTQKDALRHADEWWKVQGAKFEQRFGSKPSDAGRGD